MSTANPCVTIPDNLFHATSVTDVRPMNPEQRSRVSVLVNELRSGTWKKTKNKLARRSSLGLSTPDEFCVMGVVFTLISRKSLKNVEARPNNDNTFSFHYNGTDYGSSNIGAKDICEDFGYLNEWTFHGTVNGQPLSYHLMSINDSTDTDFPAMADMIQRLVLDNPAFFT